MGMLFGKSKKPQSRVTEHDKAVLVRQNFCCYGLYDSNRIVGTTVKCELIYLRVYFLIVSCNYKYIL